MARITSKQAKEMNEAYAKVHQNLQEKQRLTEGPLDAIPMTRERQNRQNRINALRGTLNSTGGSTGDGETRTVSSVNATGTPKVVGSSTNNNTSGNPKAQDALNRNPGNPPKGQDGLNRNPGNPPQGTPANNNQSSGGGLTTLSGRPSKLSDYAQKKVLAMKNNAGNNQTVTRSFDKSQDIGGTSAIADKDKITPVSSTSRPGGGSITLPKGGFSKFAPKNNQQQSGGQQPTQEPGVKTSQTVVKDGNRTTTTTRRSADSSTPEGAAAVNKEKSAFADRMAARRAARDGNTGSGGQPPAQGAKKPGLLGRLGSLAGKAVGSARNAATAAASNVKQGAQAAANTARNAASGIKQAATSAASNIKKGAEAVAGGAKRVAGGVADAATGNLTDFDKRGGKPQGVARVVAGGIDKLTGDRTDLDKRGPSKPAQQQEKPAQQPAQSTQQPAQQPAQPAKKVGSIEKKNRAIHGDAKIDALKAKNAEFQAARKSGNMKQYRKDNPKLSGAERAQQMAKERIAAKKAAPAKPVQKKVTSVMDMEGYDPMENLFDDTVHFLVSEGHAKDKSEAISIMSESEFIDAFNKGLTEVLNEQSEG